MLRNLLFIVPLLFQEFFHYSVGCILILIASIIASAKSGGASALVAGSVRKRTAARLTLCRFAADQLCVAPGARASPPSDHTGRHIKFVVPPELL